MLDLQTTLLSFLPSLLLPAASITIGRKTESEGIVESLRHTPTCSDLLLVLLPVVAADHPPLRHYDKDEDGYRDCSLRCTDTAIVLECLGHQHKTLTHRIGGALLLHQPGLNFQPGLHTMANRQKLVLRSRFGTEECHGANLIKQEKTGTY